MNNAGLLNTLKYIAMKLKDEEGEVESCLDVNEETFKENSEKYWRELFNIKRYETKNKKFGFTIRTDGKSVVLQMRKPQQNQAIAPPPPEPWKRLTSQKLTINWPAPSISSRALPSLPRPRPPNE